MLVIINGAMTESVSVSDRGFQFGDGVFTTLRLQANTPLFLQAHLNRLARDAASLGIDFPSKEIIRSDVLELLDLAGKDSGVVKIVLTRGAGGRGYKCPEETEVTRIVCLYDLPGYPDKPDQDGIVARLCSTRLGINARLAGIKHLNRLEQVLARAEWNDEGIREGLMLDHENTLVEGVMSNLFLVVDGVLITPLIDRCGVLGIMRTIVLRAAVGMGLTVRERRLDLVDLEKADEVFVTNSIIGIWPVIRLDKYQFSIGSITQSLCCALDALIEKELDGQCSGF